MLQNAPAPADTRFNSWAAFLLGLPSQAGKVDQLLNPNSIYMTTWAAYAQDTWQATPDLTLAYGLRWEHQLWPRRPDGLGVNRFDPADGYVYIGGEGDTPQDTGASTEGMFLPRLGATYRLNDKTVLRAGYALGADNTSFVNFRNSYPSVFAWAMPTGRFGGADNPFVPVTTLPAGPHRAGRRSRYLLGPHPAASERRHHDLCGGRRARQGPFVQRHGAARVHAVAHGPGRRTSARARMDR